MTRDEEHPATGSNTAAFASTGTVSRRRVVQGALWATPAVLVSTALPAAAASPPVRGGLLLTSFRGYQDTSTLTVTTFVSYVGDGAPSPDFPVSAVKVSISVPTVRAAAGAGTTASAGWTYTSRSTVGANEVFVYTWTGANLSGTNTITSALVAVLPKATTRTAFTITLQASGTSNAAAVTSTSQTVAIGAYSLLTIPSGLVATRDAYSGGPRFMRFVAPVLNSSATNAAPVVGLVAKITVPTAATAAGTSSATAGTWTYASSAVSGTDTVYTFNYTPGTLNTSAANTAASFQIPMVASFYFTQPTVTITFEGRSPTASDALTTVSATDTLAF